MEWIDARKESPRFNDNYKVKINNDTIKIVGYVTANKITEHGSYWMVENVTHWLKDDSYPKA